MKLVTLTSATLALVISAGAVFAQAANPTPTAPRGSAPSTTAPATTPAPTATPSKRTKSSMTNTKKAMAPRSAASMKCSIDADAKGLKGKPRKAFRKSCMKTGMSGDMKKMEMKKMN